MLRQIVVPETQDFIVHLPAEYINHKVEFYDCIQMSDIDLLQFEQANYSVLAQLPFHHRDPFDRMLIAQAITHDFTILSKDSMFQYYDVQTIF